MVRLGFVKIQDALPEGFWNISFRPSERAGQDLSSTINVRPGNGGALEYELLLDIPPGHENVGLWVSPMAERLKGMGLTRFSFDPRSLALSMNLATADALTCWGFPFFEHYAIESQVLLQIGQNRRAVYQMVTQWHERLPHVRFDPELDYDYLPSQAERERKKTNSGVKNFWRALFGRKA